MPPSEIPGLTPTDWRRFGFVAERILGPQYQRQCSVASDYLFVDKFSRKDFDQFLLRHNPTFDLVALEDYKARLRRDGYKNHRPDLLAHLPVAEFYEIKPDSRSGMTAGCRKSGVLSATFKSVKLPYRQGSRFHPTPVLLARHGADEVWFKARLVYGGLLLYRVCVKTARPVEQETANALLRLVVRRLNEQPANEPFRPLDLSAELRGMSLTDFGKAAGVTAAVAAGGLLARAGWRHFWKAVVARFAVRGATAAALAACDGPLPVGDLIAAGMALWTVVDVVRFNGELWREAERISRHEM